MKRMILIFLTIVLIIAGGIFVYSWAQVKSYINGHIEATPGSPSDFELPYEEVELTTSDGYKIKGWYIKANNPKAIVIVAHGFTKPTGGKAGMLTHAKYLFDAGYATFLLDFRSFGESSGDKIFSGIHEWKDLETAYDYLKGIEPSTKIGYFGVSYGASIAINTVGKTGKGDFIIVSVPFAKISNTQRMQIKRYGLSPEIFFPFVDLAIRLELDWNYDSYSPIYNIENVKVPLMIFRAQQDRMVDPNDAKELFDKAKTEKYFWDVESGHDIHKEKPEEFENKVLEFLKEITN